MWVKYQPNPISRNVDDCTVRALTKALEIDWDTAHDILCEASKNMATMPHSNEVMSAVLRQHGFNRSVIPNSCPDCYTVRQFAKDNPHGTFVVGTGDHVLTVQDGDWFDTWDSGKEIPLYYFYRR